MLSVAVGFPADLAKPAAVSGGDERGGGLVAAAAFLLSGGPQCWRRAGWQKAGESGAKGGKVKSALTAEHCGARDWRVSVFLLCRWGNLAGRWAGGRRAIREAMPGAMPGGIRSAKSGGAGPVLGRWSRAWGCGLRPGGLVGQATSRWGDLWGRGSGKRAGRFGGRQYRLSTPILHPSENIRIWLAQAHGLAGSGGGHRAGTRAVGGKRDGGMVPPPHGG